jgi:selenocysteine lyase/cysteine desulfurase
VEKLLHEFSLHGLDRYSRWMKRVAEVRRLFADLIHSDPDEVAFVGNTSEGLGVVASGLRWKKGDAVLIPEPDFPANVYPWINLERHGVRVLPFRRKEGRFDVQGIEKVMVPGARLVSVSTVDFVTGFRCDLEELGEFCLRKGLLFCVDAIQSLGVIPMDVKRSRIHFLAAGGHKWLLSTMGCGGLFISKEVNDLLHPERVGWKSVINEEDFSKLQFQMKPDALRFEAGTMNLLGIYALGSALELLLQVGIERIHRKVLDITTLLFQGLRERGFRVTTPVAETERAGIISFVPKSKPKELHGFLGKTGVRASLRNGLIRLSPHFYNNEEDVIRFFQALDLFRHQRF